MAAPAFDRVVVDPVAGLVADVLPGRAELAPHAPLLSLGLESLAALRLVLELRDRFGVHVEPSALAGLSLDDLRSLAGPARAVPAPVVPAGDTAGPFDLTPMQQAYTVGAQPGLTDDAVGCHVYREFEVPDLDTDRLRAAWAAVVAGHEALRLCLTPDGRQLVLPRSPEWRLAVHRLPGDPAAAGAHLAEVRDRLARPRFHLGDGPPFGVQASLRPDGSGIVHLALDAAVTDGRGLDLLLADWARAYHADGSGDGPPAPAGPALRESLGALAARREGAAYAADLAWWRHRLAAAPDGPPVAVDGRVQAPEDGPERPRSVLDALLPAPVWQALRDRALAWEVSPTALVLTAFADVLAAHSTGGPFSLVLTTTDRPYLPAGADRLVGPFTSGVVVTPPPTRELTLREAARQTHGLLWEALAHASVPVVVARREVGAADRPPPAVVFTSLLDGGPGEGFAADVTYVASVTSGIDLDHQMWETAEGLRLHWDVVAGRFPAGGAEVLFAGLVNALHALAAEDADETAEPRPLNPLQQAYYVARTADDGPWNGAQVYHAFHVEDLDLDRLEAAWLRLVRAYDPLRSAVTADGRLAVHAGAPAAWRLPVVDLRGAADPGAVLRDLAEGMVSRAFGLDRWPRCDLRVTREDGRATVHLAVDLVVLDGRSIHLLMRDLFRLHADPSAAVRPAAPYAEHAGGQARLRQTPQWEQWQAHWRDRVADLPPGPELPRPAVPEAGRRRVRLTGEVAGWDGVRAACAAAGVRPDMLLLAAFTESLAAGAAAGFALPVVRWNPAFDGFRPGELTALSWVRDGTGGGGTLLERAAALQREVDGDVPADPVGGLGELRRAVMKRRQDGDFGHPVVYTGLLELADHPLPPGVTAGPWATCTPDVDLDAIAMDDGSDLLRCFWDAVPAAVDLARLRGVFERYVAAVGGVADGAPGAAAADRVVPPGPGRDRIVYGWNDTAVPLVADGPVHPRFERAAAAHPDAPALRWSGGWTTFGALNRWANAIAWRLRDLGVGRGDAVGISTPRGPAMVAAVYGVLKAGGAYVPVEPGLPEERAAAMLGDSGAGVVLTAGGDPRRPAGGTVLDVSADRDSTDPRAASDPDPVTGPDDTAYVIFTSGSTGRPKGVEVTHRPVHNLLAWADRLFGFGPGDLGLCVTSLGFDLSVFDLLGVLGSGAGLYVADEAEQRDPQLLLDVLLRHPVTFWNSAPTTLAQLAPLLPAHAGDPRTADLRLAFLSGDWTPLPLPDQVRSVFPRATVVNLGGATEATVWSNYHVVGEVDPGWRSIPYGRPIDNSRYYVLDASLEPVPPGVEGDLYIAGACLSLGYVNRPDLTAKAFVEDPFAREPGERMYRTGDRATYLPDGVLSFRGRDDGQVKIRGFRVELGEIEHRLRRHPDVSDAVALVRPDGSGERKLVAYVVPRAGAAPTARELREHVAAALPDYMVPNFVVPLDVFPATPNGKLDRAALPWPVPPPAPAAAPEPAPELQPPGDLVDELSEIFADLLGGIAVDPDLDLWDQGATSFTMVQASGVLAKRHGRRVPVAVLVADPTIAGIARHLAGTPAPPVPAPAPEPAAPQVPAPGSVDVLSAAERARFRAGRWNLRPCRDGEPLVPLGTGRVAAEEHRARATRREFGPGPLALDGLARLLGLLADVEDEGRARRLYPSAGDTYAVQAYVHVRPGGVAGLAPGIYYHRPREHALQLVTAGPVIDRSVHFAWNRATFDATSAEIYLIGQAHGVAPLYADDADLFLALEAGYMGQALLSRQDDCGVALCPIGSLAFDRVRDRFGLDDGHRFLHAFLAGPAPAPGRVSRRAQARAREETREVETREVAVVGMAGRFPGADDLDGLWRVLRSGTSRIGPLPAGRRRALAALGAVPDVAGGFLSDLPDLAGPDGGPFGIPAAEAATLDPQTGLLLQAVWSCLENAGRTAASLSADGPVGVWVGLMWPDQQATGAAEWAGGGAAARSAIASAVANRVSHVFGLTGPSVAVDTSCASSLTALHLAAGALARGEVSAAVVAGANLVTHPYHLALLAEAGLLAESGAAGAFDASVTGWSPGEGAGALLLRRAGAAAADGDAVRAVVEATTAAHVGRVARFGVPSAEAVAASTRALLGRAGLTAADIGYVECAAAGAPLADVAELEALEAVLGGRGAPVPIGTLKPVIGHLEAASGLSQLAKVLLQLDHGELAPTPVAPERNPLVPPEDAFRVVTSVEPWTPTAGVRRALVTGIGATGSIAQAVVRGPEADR